MQQNQEPVSIAGSFVQILVLLNVIVIKYAFIYNLDWYKVEYCFLPLLVIAMLAQKKKA
ncbi:hypothetical protein [Flavihumibacter solisilvae]|jgi:hypothetical protein|uniref:hypothetical protein n=1 Tax=Flavihumibacter solisilvae TaxID=1349421 RepID=UPI000A597951|nr:hypothetical protein [Flavihumibacter solisilvae]